MWCALSRLYWPLAFAGLAAGAKPNQRFFVCQQLGRIFFGAADVPTTAGGVRRSPRRRTHAREPNARRRAHAKKTSGNARFFSSARRGASFFRDRMRQAARSRTDAERSSRGMCSACEEIVALARRTSPNAPICANPIDACTAAASTPHGSSPPVASLSHRRANDRYGVRGRWRRHAPAALNRRADDAATTHFAGEKNEEGRGLPRPSGDET